MTDLNGLQARIRTGFVSYRLNHDETLAALNSLTQAQQAAAPEQDGLAQSLSTTLDSFFKEDAHPVKPEGAPVQTIEQASLLLGLDKEIAGLNQNQVWSAEQKAVYRRMHDLKNSPDLGEKLASKGEATFVNQVEKNFQRWDSNGDKHLDTKELDAAMASNVDQGEDAAALVTVRRYFKDLIKVDSSDKNGVTMTDLNGYLASGIPGDQETTARINTSYPGMVKKAANQKPVPSFDQEIFDPKQMRQGRPGTCVLLSTTNGLGTDDVKSMFADNHNGTYTVTFKDGKHYNVAEPGFGDRLYHAQGANQGRWPELLELAMGQRIAETISTGDNQPRSVIDGIAPPEAVRAMANKDFEQHSLENISIEQTRTMLTEILGEGGPVICGSRNRKGAATEEGKALEAEHNGVANNHAYTVLKFDADKDTVTVRNPWGRGEWNGANDGVNDGTFEMPVADFYSSYRWVGGGVEPKRVRRGMTEFEGE